MKVGRLRTLFAAVAAVSMVVGIPLAGAQAKTSQNSVASHLFVGPKLTRLTSSQEKKLELQPTTQRVIVILKNEYLNLGGGAKQALSTRASAIAAAQRPVLNELSQVHATHVMAHTIINAISATVSTGEVKYLRAQSGVQAVVADKKLYLPKPVSDAASMAKFTAGSHRQATRKAGAPTCNVNKPLLEPQALTQINAAFQNPTQKGQASLLANGSGVTVAFMADGVTWNDPDFIRPNGQYVFSDVEDFSGSGGYFYGGDDEGMLDASSIAAQGNERYFIGDWTAPDDAAFNTANDCPVIKIEGDAPGASLMDLQVFGDFTTTTSFLQAIQYGVANGASVINQSFGGNPYPDENDDPISLADKAAVADGVLIVASSGDAGSDSTQGSPSTLPGVISVGASTSFQSYMQAGYQGTSLSNGTYTDDGVSALSSAGPNQAGDKGVDLLAPGDLNWTLCDPGGGCTDESDNDVGFALSGGTSESSPLTAGVAADVIQKYRETHKGKSPSPEVIKEIIISSATNLDLPSNIQGAGLLNAFKAVELAAGWGKSKAKEHLGNPIAIDVNNCATSAVCNETLSASGAPGTAESWNVKVTNYGVTPETVSAKVQSSSAPSNQSGVVTLQPGTDPTFVAPAGDPLSYKEVNFTVAANTDDINAQIGWDNSLDEGGLVRIALLDPNGTYSCYSLPQGLGNGYGNCMVHNPLAGTWTLVVFTYGCDVVTCTNGDPEAGYSGNVNWTVASSSFHTAGSVAPASKTIKVGDSANFTVHENLPATAGDAASSVLVSSKVGGNTVNQSVVPIIQRALIPTTALHGGTFSGTLVGGNARPDAGNASTYQFTVPSGQNDVSVSLAEADQDSEDSIEGILTNPSGVPVDAQSNVTSIDPSSGIPDGFSPTLQMFHMQPEAGVWTLTVLVDFYSGPETSEPFTGTIAFDTVNVQSSGIPDSSSTVVSPEAPATATITVTNTGSSVENYFLDPRLSTDAGYYLLPPGDDNGGYPYMVDEFILPTESSTLDFLPSGSDSSPLNVEGVFIGGQGPVGGLGDPDGFDAGSTNSPVLQYSAPEIPNGYWEEIADDLACPCDQVADYDDDITVQAAAEMQDFNSDIATDTGDFYTAGANPISLAPGQHATINVEITPSNSPGTDVSGTIYVDTLGIEAPGYLNNGGVVEEVAAVPYAYQAGS